MSRRAQSTLIWLSTLLFAMIPVVNGIGRDDRFIGSGVDVFGTFWFYWWVEDSLSNGVSPGFTNLMFHPEGKDIFAHTGGNFVDALVSVPFQSIFGVPGFQAWFILAVLMGNAFTFRALAGGVITSSLGVWAASILWMLNPYVLQELSSGRITQAFLWFLPLAFHFFLRAETSRRAAILAGVFTGLQAWTYWFMAWFMLPAFACLAWAKWRGKSAARSVLVRSYGLAALSAFIVVAPGLWMMVDRMSVGPVAGVSAVGSTAEFWGSLFATRAGELQGWIDNERHGIHSFGQWFWAMLALSALLLPAGRRRWGWVLAVSLAFSIGPTLTLGDDWAVPMVHYRLAVQTIPFLERLWFPYRWTVVAFLAASLVGGFWVQYLHRRWRSRWLGALPVVLTLLTVLEQRSEGTIPLVTRTYEVPAVYGELGKRTGGIIELPMEVVRESLMWQPLHGLPLFGGMGENVRVFWSPTFKHAMGNRFIRALRQRTRGAANPILPEPSEVEAIQERGMRWVVLDRHTLLLTLARSGEWGLDPQARSSLPVIAVAKLSELMGPPVAVDGPLVVWDLKRGGTFPGFLAPTPETIGSNAWAGGDWAAYEDRVVQLNDQ
jgi:hypothetical protein